MMPPMMNPVLLLVDLQNDYLGAPGLEPGRGYIVERAAALLHGCRELAMPVIHIWTTVSRNDDRRMPHWKRAGRWICEAGTPGHALPESLQPRDGERVVHKTSFSAFSNPELEAQLRELKADTIIVAGVHIHACVRQTALDAAERSYDVWIAQDAVGSDDPVHGAITRRYLASRVAHFADVEKLIMLLRGNGQADVPEPAISESVARARHAFSRWRDTDHAEKSAMLERLAVLLEENANDLAEQMAREMGKPVFYGRTEAVRTAAMLRAITRRIGRAADESDMPGVTVCRRPHGAVALITPWNNPIYIALGKIAPALLCGNTVVWKPSPLARAISQKVFQLLMRAGAAENTVCILLGSRSAAEALMSDAGVDAVSLTGSSAAGFSAQEICARRRIPLQAELGGNNAAIVWPDCDLRDAVRAIAEGAFGMAGQRCTANRRVIVHREVHDVFLDLLSAATAVLPAGNPLLPETRLGPLVSAQQRNRVAALLERSASEKIRVIQSHGTNFAPLDDGQGSAWHPPVIVCCDDPACDLVQEETFGPVLVVQTANDWDHAITLCNGVRQGLAAALFSTSANLHRRFLNEAQAGILKINRATADAEVDVPFGGWKSSGVGPPEHGSFDRDFYTRPQTRYGVGL